MAGTAAVLGATGLSACAEDTRGNRIKPVAPKDGGPLATTAEVPVGGCFVVDGSKVVLSQPEQGTFKCFSSICTHQGCTVSSSTDGTIPCHCHGSQFSLEDGSVVQGPATTGLAAVDISVDGESISLA